MNARPLVFLKESQLHELHRLISRAIEKWAEEWVGEIDPPVINCARAWEMKPLPTRWSHFCEDRKKRIYFYLTGDFLTDLRHCLFETEQRHALRSDTADIAQEAAAAAASTLIDSIAASFGLAKTCMPVHEDVSLVDREFVNGSGAAIVNIAFGKCCLCCLLNYDSIRAFGATVQQQKEPGLSAVNLKNAMAGTPLSLPVELGQVEIDIGNLLSLQIGDVIRLDTGIDEPLAIKGPDGQRLLGGYLGSKGKNIAVEVVPLKQ